MGTVRQDASVCVLEGGRSLATGPGQLGRGGAAGVVVWNASTGIAGQDLFAGFWRDEAGRIDWLKGYLCDPAMVVLFEELALPEEAAEAAEEIYSRKAMNSLGGEMEGDYQ